VDSVASSLFAVGLCVLLSAFTSAAETALTALGEPRARQLIEERGHRSLRLWIDHPERVLATLLLANTITTTLAAAIMTQLIHELGAPNAVALSTGAVTLLILTFGEITPKTLARGYADKLAPLVMPGVTAAYFVSYPITWLLSRLPRWLEHRLTRRNGGPPADQRPPITSEEIEYMIDLGAREGVLDREKSALLTSVLEFSDTVVREIMVPRLKVVGIPVDANREEALKLLLESQHSRIPVYEGSIDEVVGVLHAKTLLADVQAQKADKAFDIKSYIGPPLFVPELMKISRLLREFQRLKVHLAIVVDEFGGTAGVVSLEDVVEEIVGEIQDEQDVEEKRVRVLPNGNILADAALPLRDLEDVLHVDFPAAPDYDSLGGFVTATVGKVPPVNSVILWRGLRFTVKAGDERHVTRVEIMRVPERKSEGPHIPDGPAGNPAGDQAAESGHVQRNDRGQSP
jgi:CBS domain containing-hemolysin-like protein